MKSTQKLALRREVLASLDPTELGAVAGAGLTRNDCLSNTCQSCLTYVSCSCPPTYNCA